MEKGINAYSIAARALGFHLTVETPRANPAFATIEHVDTVLEALHLAHGLIDPEFTYRVALANVITRHVARHPVALIDVEFYETDEGETEIAVRFFYGGVTTDSWTVHPNGIAIED